MVKKNYDDMLSRFHLVPERNGQTDRRQTDGRTDGRTDGQTDRQICYINIARAIKIELTSALAFANTILAIRG